MPCSGQATCAGMAPSRSCAAPAVHLQHAVRAVGKAAFCAMGHPVRARRNGRIHSFKEQGDCNAKEDIGTGIYPD